MTDPAEQIINEIIQMREQYLAEVGEDRRRAWPKSIRERIISLDAMEIPRKEIARLTGVPYETIAQWRHYQKKLARRRFHALSVSPRNATVTVASQDENSNSNVSVTVTSPTGYRVEGPVDVVVRVLKALGGV
jgi:hypothetical protein